MKRIIAVTTMALAMVVFAQSGVMGQLLLSEQFDYADGDLTTVSSGEWVTHSGDVPDIQVVGGKAVVTSPGSADDNRLVGSIMGENDIWYYAVRFTTLEGIGPTINPDYFIHLKDETSFGYNARLAYAAPDDPERDFSFEIWASSGGDGSTAWTGDFDFGDEVVAVVRWNNGTGEATLWINPVDENSTSIVDDELPDAMRAVESIALRQDGGQSGVVEVDAVAVALDFASALAEVASTTGGTVDVSADSANVSAGVEFGGSFADLSASDNADYSIVRDNGSVQARVQLELKATSPSETPTAIEFTWESSIFARTQVDQTIFLFNYQSASFEELDTRPAMRFSDQTVVVTPTGDLSRFVEPGTGCMEARIRYQSLNPRQVFTANMDFANWNITF